MDALKKRNVGGNLLFEGLNMALTKPRTKKYDIEKFDILDKAIEFTSSKRSLCQSSVSIVTACTNDPRFPSPCPVWDGHGTCSLPSSLDFISYNSL